MRPLLLLLSTTLLAGCDAASGPSPSASSTGTTKPAPPPPATPAPSPSPSATATAPAKPLASNALEMPGLKIYLEPPGGVTGKVNEIKNGESIITFPGADVQLAVGPAYGNFEFVKKKYGDEKNFVRWVAEAEDNAVAEVKTDKANEYYGFLVRDVGGKSYQCVTITMKRNTSPSLDGVKKVLEYCKTMRVK
ncbi:MAG: hypothetical protein U0414_02180 [Polyangiaceae bacterium]